MKPSWLTVLRHNSWQALLLVDQMLGLLVCTALKELGWADLTLSANAWRWEQEDKHLWLRVLIDALFFWQTAHCFDAYVYEIERRHLPESMR